MNEKENRKFLYKYFHWFIVLLSFLLLPFLFLSYENDYYELLEEYDDAVMYAIENQFSQESQNEILELMAQAEVAKYEMHYKMFITVIIVAIFLSLFNYFYLKIGIKAKILNNTPDKKLNRYLFMIISIFEILYFVILVAFTNKEFIGNNIWTLFFVNLIVLVFVIVILLQLKYLLNSKDTE